MRINSDYSHSDLACRQAGVFVLSMVLKNITLQNFRNYTKAAFAFSKGTTLIVGPNTAGKTNLIEAIFLLSLGKSFRADKDLEMIRFGEEVARVKGETKETMLEAVISMRIKKYLVNGVSKRRVDFIGNFAAVLFSPLDLDIIVTSPTLRRNFLDDVLQMVDRDYRLSHIEYTKALRQRNALLELAKEVGKRSEKQFEYWDTILIQSGHVLTQKRQEFIEFMNAYQKDIFDCAVFYDKSILSKERLLQYKDAELGVGVTLVGPHRDDFSVHMYNDTRQTTHDIKLFGSRGQQRLVVLQLKLLQLNFVEKRLGVRPALLLDDIFSELDENHIQLVLELTIQQQTIITTTHKEFIPQKLTATMNVIELK